jgi:polyribonucleotide nucleotidyltransferase
LLLKLTNYSKTLKYRTVRDNILSGKPRIDGRDTKTVRAIDVQVGVLGRAHGSALFTRGETQALVTATLGNTRDALMVDTLLVLKLIHSCCTTTSLLTLWVKLVVNLVLNVVKLVMVVWHVVVFKQFFLPADRFPYVLRIVSDITESNGSSSMASVCGASLSLDGCRCSIESTSCGYRNGLGERRRAFCSSF